MIGIKDIEKLVLEKLEGTKFFLVEVKVSPSNAINVYIDSPTGLGIEDCIIVSKHIEEAYDREVEDYSLEVSSPGIGQPLRVLQQYKKVIGKTVEVLFNDGKKQQGLLTEADEKGFTIEYTTREKVEGTKRPKDVEKSQRIEIEETKATIEIIKV